MIRRHVGRPTELCTRGEAVCSHECRRLAPGLQTEGLAQKVLDGTAREQDDN